MSGDLGLRSGDLREVSRDLTGISRHLGAGSRDLRIVSFSSVRPQAAAPTARNLAEREGLIRFAQGLTPALLRRPYPAFEGFAFSFDFVETPFATRMAEREGFEPPVSLHPRQFSRLEP